VCLVYVADLRVRTKSHKKTEQMFRRSRWFTRGWTLQELSAQSHLPQNPNQLRSDLTDQDIWGVL